MWHTVYLYLHHGIMLMQMSDVFDIRDVLDMKQKLKNAVRKAMVSGAVDGMSCRITAEVNRGASMDSSREHLVVKEVGLVRQKSNHRAARKGHITESVFPIDD